MDTNTAPARPLITTAKVRIPVGRVAEWVDLSATVEAELAAYFESCEHDGTNPGLHGFTRWVQMRDESHPTARYDGERFDR